jgi:hypothetical protein
LYSEFGLVSVLIVRAMVDPSLAYMSASDVSAHTDDRSLLE